MLCDCVLLNNLPLELAHKQMMEETAPVEQLLVRALLDDLSVPDHDDIISVTNGAEAVRNDEGSAPFHQP